jgi:hypothetical protein
LFPGSKGVIKLSSNIKSTPNTLSYYKWGIDSRSVTGITLDKIVEDADKIVEDADGNITLNVYLSK